MAVKNVFVQAVAPYGQVRTGCELDGPLSAMKKILLPEEGAAVRLSGPNLDMENDL